MGHPNEVDEIFNAISYSKGASVIRMLHDYIGDEVGQSSYSIFGQIIEMLVLCLKNFIHTSGPCFCVNCSSCIQEILL